MTSERTEVQCSACGEHILSTAQKCKHCGTWQTQNRIYSAPHPNQQFGSQTQDTTFLLVIISSYVTIEVLWSVFNSLNPSERFGENYLSILKTVSFSVGAVKIALLVVGAFLTKNRTTRNTLTVLAVIAIALFANFVRQLI
jgi:hypothetical protein